MKKLLWLVYIISVNSAQLNSTIVKNEFKNLKQTFELIKEKYFAKQDSFKEISMGMSGDYQLAIQNGSTMVRVGSKIFGGR